MLPDINRFTWAFSSLMMKILLIERLRAIWNGNFIGERVSDLL